MSITKSQNARVMSEEAIQYLCKCINLVNSLPTSVIDNLHLADNLTFSSTKIDSLLTILKEDCNKYTDSIVANLSRLELKVVTNEADMIEHNKLYLIKKAGETSYSQYVIVTNDSGVDEKILLGTTDISMTDYLKITDAVATYCKKTDFDALKTEVTNLKTKVGTDTLNTTSQTLSGGVNELKTDLTTHTSDTNIHVTTSDKTKWNKVDNKVDKNTSIKLKPLSNGSYCAINSYIANNNEFISLDIIKSDGKINRLELTNEGNVLNHINYNGSKWIRIGRFCTTNVADVGMKTITPTLPSTVTLGSSQRVIYSIKNGWANVSIVAQFASPKLSWTAIATGLPKPDKTVNTSTVGETFVNANVAYRIKTDGTLEMRIDSEITQLNWWNINVSYPVVDNSTILH